MPALAVATRSTDQDTDDLALVAALRGGDERAFELLYLRYQGRIFAYVRGMVGDHGRAEDITQEVFMSALRRMRETEREIVFKPWIYEIAKNACIDSFRRRRNANEVSIDADGGLAAADAGAVAAPGLSPDAVVEGKVALDQLCGAFGGLSQVHHDILVMREFEGLSYREIGERLGLSRPAVESTLFRARRKLTDEYEELASGARCVRVQRIVDAPSGQPIGVRDQRRMARHLSHCQPCRRYARLAGVELDPLSRPAAAAARIAAFVPLPLFMRRRFGAEDATPLLAQPGGNAVSQWSASIVQVLDPAAVSSWGKAVVTATTVAVASVGAGAAVTDRNPFAGFVPKRPALTSIAPAGDSVLRLPSLGRRAAPFSGSAIVPSLDRAAGSGAPAGGAGTQAAQPRTPAGEATDGAERELPASSGAPLTAPAQPAAGSGSSGTTDEAAGSSNAGAADPSSGSSGDAGPSAGTGSDPQEDVATIRAPGPLERVIGALRDGAGQGGGTGGGTIGGGSGGTDGATQIGAGASAVQRIVGVVVGAVADAGDEAGDDATAGVFERIAAAVNDAVSVAADHSDDD